MQTHSRSNQKGKDGGSGKMKKLIIVLIISVFLISGCASIGEICSQFFPEAFCRIFTCVFGEEGMQNMVDNLEVRKFLQANPDAEMTITLMSKQNVLKNINTLSMELGTKPAIKDYIKLELKSDEKNLIVFVDADSKKLNYVKLETVETKDYSIFCDQMDDICGDDFTRMCELTCPEIEPAKTEPIVKPAPNPIISKPPLPASRPTPPANIECYKDSDCEEDIDYSCNFQENPVRVTTSYKCENNKCKLSSTQTHTLDICNDNEYCEEGTKNCLQSEIIIEEVK